MAHIEANAIIAGKYRLVRQLSGGGMGAVWLAHHEQLDAPVAVKFMHGSLLDMTGARARFEREAKAAAQLRSPYVVHVYDHGIDDETPFIVMEYLEGEDLGRRLKRERLLPLDVVTRICEQVCKGLYRAHRAGIVHRDLKPGNVWLCSEDDDMVKLLDFGIAKETGNRRVVKGETTTTGQVLGSPHYMSPEQARGQALDGRSDLWSLAVILYRALTGKRPFDGQDIGDLIVRICTDPIAPPSSLRPELGRVVDHFFERAFNRNPDARFQSAKAFAAEFKAALSRVQPAELAGTGSSTAPLASSSWDSRDSSSFTSEPFDQDAPTQVTPSLTGASAAKEMVAGNTVTAVETLSVGASQSRSKIWLVAGVGLVAFAVVGGVWATMGGGSDGTQALDAAPVEPSAALPLAAGTEPNDAPSAAVSAEPAVSASATASAAASSAATASASARRVAPPPVVRPRRPKTPPPPRVPDLGY